MGACLLTIAKRLGLGAVLPSVHHEVPGWVVRDTNLSEAPRNLDRQGSDESAASLVQPDGGQVQSRI